MNFELSDAQRMMQEMVREFAEKDIKPRAAEIDRTDEFPWDLWKRMAELGLLGMTLPPEYGGSGMDIVSWAIAQEEMARASVVVADIQLLTLLLTSITYFPVGSACKDIIATTQATGANYTLLLKVRDPSRPGLQVLTRIPRGTTYTYHYPWSGKPWEFTVKHTFFGVATQGDALPNTVKAGMTLTDAGLAFADADTASGWVNPTKNAWDDFDWIRYACQTSDDEAQAVTLLTTDAIDKMHATSVGENLFLVSPLQSIVIEADAAHYAITNVNGVWVMSNYPITLWRTELLKSLPIARGFDTQKDTWVQQGSTVRLGSLCGAHILTINESAIIAQPFPAIVFQHYGEENPVTIPRGQRATVGPYSVVYKSFQGRKAEVSVQTAYYAWEQELLAHINPAIGHITIQDMITWSRLHTSDLDGLRPLCEDAYPYEAVMVSKVPVDHADVLSGGWFSANHACSSIYVPFHICDDDIYNPYQTGEAAQLSLDLLKKYGHATLIPGCQSVETVFLAETNLSEAVAHALIHNNINITPFLTTVDTGMQEQAYLTEELWYSMPNSSRDVVITMWKNNYSTSLDQMETKAGHLSTHGDESFVLIQIETIALSICKTRITQAITMGIPCAVQQQEYTAAEHEFSEGRTAGGFALLQHIFHSTNIPLG